MPYADPAKQREFQRRWMADRRKKFFAGKSCEKCSSTHKLELHHVNPEEKWTHRFWSYSWEKILAEAAKCVVWCHGCHVAHHKQNPPRHFSDKLPKWARATKGA